jgi:hypothetical protein
MQVYTPPGYNHDTRAYPVLYLMHGGGGNDTDWTVNMRANYIMDNVLAAHRIKPMIVVTPDGNVTSSFNINYSVPQDEFPKELTGSIIPHVEKNYRVAPGARNGALAGLSLGGLWTLDTLLFHSGTFAYLGVFSSGWFLFAGEVAGAALEKAAHSLGGVRAAENAWHVRAEMLDRRAFRSRSRHAGVCECGLYPERCLRGDHGSDLGRSLELRGGRNDLLHQADPYRLLGPELLGGKQEPHRVPPAELARCAKCRPSERHDAPGDLQLAEAHVVRCNHDVGCER